MSTTETKTASGVILAPDLATRYKLAEAQLALIPPIDEDDAEEWAGLRQHCEEVMLFIERLSAAEERERVLIAEVKKANLWLAHRQQVIDNFFAALATPAPFDSGRCHNCKHDKSCYYQEQHSSPEDVAGCEHWTATPAPEQENKPQLQWHSLSDKPPANERVLLSDPLESTFSSRTPFCGMAHVDSNGVWCIMHNGQSEPIHPSHLHKAMWSPRPYPPAPEQPSEQNGGSK